MAGGVARALLQAHADREETGELTDPAALAAVVGIERLSLAAGTTDPERLRALLAEPPEEHRGLVEELRAVVEEGIDRREVGRSPDSAMVNADSGHHMIETRAAPLRAAVRAATATWRAFPYYEARYGARGARFAGSDSSWLVSLAPLTEDQAIHQASWLARVLAQRGMPSWLLERHLDDLAAEVGRSLGEDEVGVLPAAAAALRARRQSVVPDALLVTADAWAVEEIPGELPVASTGALLAAARADVATGLATGDASLVDWLTDPERVPEQVADGVRRVRERVREAAAREAGAR